MTSNRFKSNIIKLAKASTAGLRANGARSIASSVVSGCSDSWRSDPMRPPNLWTLRPTSETQRFAPASIHRSIDPEGFRKTLPLFRIVFLRFTVNNIYTYIYIYIYINSGRLSELLLDVFFSNSVVNELTIWILFWGSFFRFTIWIHMAT